MFGLQWLTCGFVLFLCLFNDIAFLFLEMINLSFFNSERFCPLLQCYQADSRSAAISRTQIFADKDGSSVQAVSAGSMRVEEKTRRLLAGGEGLDQRIKKKRSVGAVGNRIINVDRDAKRAVQPKMTADSKLRSCDAHGFRYLCIYEVFVHVLPRLKLCLLFATCRCSP